MVIKNLDIMQRVKRSSPTLQICTANWALTFQIRSLHAKLSVCHPNFRICKPNSAFATFAQIKNLHIKICICRKIRSNTQNWPLRPKIAHQTRHSPTTLFLKLEMFPSSSVRIDGKKNGEKSQKKCVCIPPPGQWRIDPTHHG